MAKLKGAAKAAFLARMAKGRRKAAGKNPKKKRKANPSVRKSKKTIGKGFSKPVAAEWSKAKKKKARASKKKRASHSHKNGVTLRRSAAPARSRKKRRNSDGLDGAEAKFQEFHGRRASRVLEYDEEYRYHENFAEMGKLIELRFHLDSANKHFPLTQFGKCQAVCTPDGSNIYFIGGDQTVDFEALDIASDKDMVELGPCSYICYFTVKGFHDFEPTKYWHEFGEEDGILPVLVYDRLNKSLLLVGGNYRVRPEGIVN